MEKENDHVIFVSTVFFGFSHYVAFVFFQPIAKLAVKLMNLKRLTFMLQIRVFLVFGGSFFVCYFHYFSTV